MTVTDPKLNPCLEPGQSPGDVTINFGSHKGRRLCELPEKYLRWIINNHSQTGLASLARHVLGDEDVDQDEDPTEPAPVLAAVAMPYVTFSWKEVMEAKVTTPEGRRVVALGLIELKKLCSKYTRKRWNCDEPPPDSRAECPNYATTEGR